MTTNDELDVDGDDESLAGVDEQMAAREMPVGTAVVVVRAQGRAIRTVTTSEPTELPDGRWVVRCAGIKGDVALDEVRAERDLEKVAIDPTEAGRGPAQPDEIVEFARPRGGLAERTERVLASLTPREREVVMMRFGMGKKGDGK